MAESEQEIAAWHGKDSGALGFVQATLEETSRLWCFAQPNVENMENLFSLRSSLNITTTIMSCNNFKHFTVHICVALQENPVKVALSITEL